MLSIMMMMLPEGSLCTLEDIWSIIMMEMRMAIMVVVVVILDCIDDDDDWRWPLRCCWKHSGNVSRRMPHNPETANDLDCRKDLWLRNETIGLGIKYFSLARMKTMEAKIERECFGWECLWGSWQRWSTLSDIFSEIKPRYPPHTNNLFLTRRKSFCFPRKYSLATKQKYVHGD